MNVKLQRDLFIAFFRAGMLGYGGGPSSIPLMHKEVVERYGWMNDEEFSDVLALGNTLPGPIATKMAGYIGYRIGGVIGLLNTIIATVLPTVVLMLLLIGTISTFKDVPFVQGMTAAIGPIVGVMLLVLALQFFWQSKQGNGWSWTVFLSLISILVLELLGLHPAILIGALLIIAIAMPTKQKKKEGEAA